MMVRGDEPGHHDGARTIDHLRIAGGQVRADGGDLRPVDEHIGPFEIAHTRIEAQHSAAAQQDAAPPAVADETLGIGVGCCP